MKNFEPIFAHEFYKNKYLAISTLKKLCSKNLVIEKKEFYFPHYYAKLCLESIEIISEIIPNINELQETFPSKDIALKFITNEYQEHFGYHFIWDHQNKTFYTNEKYKEVDNFTNKVQCNILNLFSLEKLREIAIAGYGATHNAIKQIEKSKMSLSGFVLTLETETEPLMRIYWVSKDEANIHNELGQFNMIPAIKKMKELELIEL